MSIMRNLIRNVIPTTGIAALALICASLLPAAAQKQTAERQISAAPNQDVRVGMYINTRPDCSSGPLPTIRLVQEPTQGKVIVKRGRFKATNFGKCLAMDVPALLVMYHAAANFNGGDEFQLDITFPENREHVERIRVNAAKPGTELL